MKALALSTTSGSAALAGVRKRRPGSSGAQRPLQSVGLLGLGIMGSAMAGNLIKGGFKVSGFDPNAAARKHLRMAGGRVSANAAALAGEVDVIITSLPSAAALMQSMVWRQLSRQVGEKPLQSE